MEEVSRRSVGVLAALGLFILLAIAVVMGVQEYQHTHTPGHGSPSDLGIGARNTLQNHLVADSRNCVGKTRPGNFTAVGKTYDNGRLTDVARDGKFDGNATCHNTGRNQGAHRVAIDWDGAGYENGPKKDHGN